MTFGGAFGGSVNFENNSGTKLVATKTLNNVPINYSGSGSRTFSARISGAYNGVTPRHEVTYGLPARPAAPPDPVPTPSVTNITSGGATASWSAPDSNGDSIDQYGVLWETASGVDVHFDTTSSRAHTTSGRAPNGDYRVRVKAHNGAGWGDYGNFRSFTTDVAVPGTIGGRATSNITSSGARFSWVQPDTGGGTIDFYEVVWRKASESELQSVDDDTGSPRDVTDLEPATNYVWNIRAHNQAGYGPYSATSVPFTTLATVPGPPTQSAPTVLDHQSIRLNYALGSDGGSDVTGWQHQLATNATFTTGVITSAVVPVPTGGVYTFSGLGASTTYYSRVRGVNAVGTGAWSATKSAATDPAPITDPNLAPQVSGLTASSFSLKGVAGVSTRDFQIATNVGFTTGVVNKVVTTQSALFQDVKPGTTLWGRYRIDSGTGYGAYSPAVSFTPPRRPVRWDGAHWVDDISYWNGTEWGIPTGPQKRWSGSAWL